MFKFLSVKCLEDSTMNGMMKFGGSALSAVINAVQA